MKRPILAVLGLGFLTCIALGVSIWRSRAANNALSESWIVVDVTTGATLTIGRQGQEKQVKLCGITTPAPGQPLGDEAKQHLEQLLGGAEDFVQVVEVAPTGRDSTLVEVYTIGEPEKLMQEELLLKGLAAIALDEVEQCPNARSMSAAEEIAKEEGIGQWSVAQ